MRKLLLLAVAGLFCTSAAHADFTGKDASAATITFKNPNVCTSVACVPIFQMTDGSGAAFGVVGSPVYVAPGTGATFPVSGTFWQTTQPVSAASLPLPTGAATSANQASQITQETAINTALGAPTDAVCATATGNCSLTALTKYSNNTPPVLGAGTATVGNVGSDPSSGKGTPSSKAINVSTATTTQLVAISGTTKIYVTSFDVIAGGTGNITFEYGTQTTNPCDTGTTALTGPYNLTAQAGIAKGDGVGAVLVVPAGNALCVLTSAAVQMSGSVSYQQF
jgi:hypothetical protein